MESKLLSYKKRIVGKCSYLFHIARYSMMQERFPMLSPIARILDVKSKGVVLMLHRVTENKTNGLPNNEDMKVSPAFLQQTIDKYRKAGFIFATIDDVARMVSSGRFSSRPFVAFTLDDGYLDNYTEAFPVFKRNNVPFCIYISSEFVNKRAILWWYVLDQLIMANDKVVYGSGDVIYCRTFQEKWNAFRTLREKILRLNQDNLLYELESMFCRYYVDWTEPVRHLAMDWSHVEILAKESLCTIGGHTRSHIPLARLKEDDMHNEILQGNEELALHIGHSIRHFSYPYGEAGEREFTFVDNEHFDSASLADGGCVSSRTTRAACIPRVMLIPPRT